MALTDLAMHRIQEALRGASEEQLQQINALVIQQLNLARVQRAQRMRKQLKVGDRVILTGLKPKYLNGLVGTIIATPEGQRVKAMHCWVELDQRVGRYSDTVQAPFSALKLWGDLSESE